MRRIALPRCIVEHRLRGVTEKTTGCVMLSDEYELNMHETDTSYKQYLFYVSTLLARGQT